MSTRPVWSPAEREQIYALKRENYTYVEIAEKMSRTLGREVTKGMISGVMNTANKPDSYAVKAKPPTMPLTKPKDLPQSASWTPPERILVAPAKKLNGELYGMEDLGHRNCRWPYGDPLEKGFHFCANGKKREDVYCPVHTNQQYGRA